MTPVSTEGTASLPAGTVLAGKSMKDAGEDLLRLVIETASGAPARNETNGEREISIWKNGVTL